MPEHDTLTEEDLAAMEARGEGREGDSGKPKQYTEEEVKNLFLDHIRNMVDYWENETRTPTIRGKLEGLAFSILVAIDGEAGDLPSWILAPMAPPQSPAYLKEHGENWYPTNESVKDKVECDIGGTLHETFLNG